jgi:hypothetical protein
VEGKRFALLLSVPRDGVKLVKQGEALPPKKPAGPVAERTVVSGSFFQRKEQYAHTITQLEKVHTARLRDLVDKAKGKGLGAGALAGQVDRLRKGFDDNARRLGKEIEADRALFSLGSKLGPDNKSEKAQLLALLNAAKARFRKRCEAAVRQYGTKTSEEVR